MNDIFEACYVAYYSFGALLSCYTASALKVGFCDQESSHTDTHAFEVLDFRKNPLIWLLGKA